MGIIGRLEEEDFLRFVQCEYGDQVRRCFGWELFQEIELWSIVVVGPGLKYKWTFKQASVLIQLKTTPR